ncbi:MAG TPA: DoxX family protein [Archangium sp.]|jgi:uncharacterized membrane protein YphA (DoxX/SURF4 family)|uniref:DoxX family protein n=1 Tax=Archangium sp. TaxID=1872627 RepID=UPI002ED7D4AC
MPASIAAPQASRGLRIALWVAQALLAVAFIGAGLMKSTVPIEELAKNMSWVPRYSPGMVRFIGASELLGGVGLLPALTRILPVLTPVAASALTLVMVLAAGEHLTNGEAPMVVSNLVLGGLAAFIAWGRFTKAPIAPR